MVDVVVAEFLEMILFPNAVGVVYIPSIVEMDKFHDKLVYCGFKFKEVGIFRFNVLDDHMVVRATVRWNIDALGYRYFSIHETSSIHERILVAPNTDRTFA